LEEKAFPRTQTPLLDATLVSGARGADDQGDVWEPVADEARVAQLRRDPAYLVERVNGVCWTFELPDNRLELVTIHRKALRAVVGAVLSGRRADPRMVRLVRVLWPNGGAP
jgi:hypothetical protein